MDYFWKMLILYYVKKKLNLIILECCIIMVNFFEIMEHIFRLLYEKFKKHEMY